ncbi:aldehyde dehydrogenase family protein [Cohnella sp. JJ-181]|uniref:aldehyde dehydrogenase family protein n=1 Tax=Cohnella rhizoplanae TaxID=2974897 RepID=UPI0022FF7547|nr:aldehyde dehydrogenase family protein [Cohnella sp. JJ-181]CAI6030675.1 NADP-dependent glyceraldehyde-3-phosphate dehydrogenase [Cohnella sp. JJ-181]
MSVRKHLWIGGADRETRSYVPLTAPYDGGTLAEIANAEPADVELAIVAAADAASVMRALPAHRRSAILERLSDLLTERREEAARIVAQEAAKPLKAAYAEIDRTAATYKFAAEEAKRLHGETVPMDAAPGGEGRVAYTKREPIGVVGAITPFNFPMNLVAHKVGPALAAGNAVVLKPATQTPLSAFYIAELLHEAGLPAGALNVVTGDGKRVGEQIVADPRIGAVSFTGSAAVGASIRAQAGLKRVTLELGSNSAVIVDDDADLDAVARRCAEGAFGYQGQVCISLQRIYAMASVADALAARIAEAASRLVVGDPLDPRTDLSAMIAPREASRASAWIDDAVRRGATLLAGGPAHGAVLPPSVLTGVPDDAELSRREAFAPVVLVNKVDSIAEAIARANDSSYGLQVGIYTNRLDVALRATEELAAGTVLVNDIPTFRLDHMPYGGVKESGLGREGVRYAIEALTELKLVIWRSAIK